MHEWLCNGERLNERLYYVASARHLSRTFAFLCALMELIIASAVKICIFTPENLPINYISLRTKIAKTPVNIRISRGELSKPTPKGR